MTSYVGSGDLIVAFSTTTFSSALPNFTVIAPARPILEDDDAIDGIYTATVEATQAAIYDALFESKTTSGNRGVTVYGLPVDRVLEMLRTAGAITGARGSSAKRTDVALTRRRPMYYAEPSVSLYQDTRTLWTRAGFSLTTVRRFRSTRNSRSRCRARSRAGDGSRRPASQRTRRRCGARSQSEHGESSVCGTRADRRRRDAARARDVRLTAADAAIRSVPRLVEIAEPFVARGARAWAMPGAKSSKPLPTS